MNCFALKLALKRVAVGLALILTVGLLTLIFNFLGTITSAVLLGMIMGTDRTWKIQSCLVSIIFPATIFAMSQFFKVLPLRESTMLAGVSFASFWIVYFLTMILMFVEKKGDGKAREVRPGAVAAAIPASMGTAPATAGGGERNGAVDPYLQELQGTWTCDAAGLNGGFQRKVIAIAGNQVELDLVEEGKVRCLAKGGMRLERLGPFCAVKFVEMKTGSGTRAPEALGISGTCIYRTRPTELIMAFHFEAAVSGQDPVVERYRRIAAGVKMPDVGRVNGECKLGLEALVEPLPGRVNH